MPHLVIENIEPKKVSFDADTNTANLNFTIEVAEKSDFNTPSFNIARYAFCAKADYTSEVDNANQEYLETLDFTEVTIFKYSQDSDDATPVIMSPKNLNNFKARVHEETSVCFDNR